VTPLSFLQWLSKWVPECYVLFHLAENLFSIFFAKSSNSFILNYLHMWQHKISASNCFEWLKIILKTKTCLSNYVKFVFNIDLILLHLQKPLETTNSCLQKCHVTLNIMKDTFNSLTFCAIVSFSAFKPFH
jgi:hypothetical protein